MGRRWRQRLRARWREMQRTRRWLARPMTRGQGLTLAMVFVLVTAIIGGVIDGRRALSDHRQAHNNRVQHALNGKFNRAVQSICTVLNGIPRTPPIQPPSERHAIHKAYRVNHCRPLPSPPAATVRPTPSATPSAPSGPTSRPTPTTVVVRPTARTTITAVHTKTAKPKPTHTRRPSPEPTKSCLLGIKTSLTCPKN